MKKLLITLLFSITMCFSFGQLAPLVQQAKDYLDSNIVSNTTRKITPTILHTSIDKVIAALNYIDTSDLFKKDTILQVYPFTIEIVGNIKYLSIDTSAGKWRSENYYDTKYLQTGSYSSLTDLTYSELTSAISGKTLTAGGNYRITDFRSVFKIYGISDTTSGDVEPLIIKATSDSTLSKHAYSPKYPDDIIEYSVIDNSVIAPVAGSKGAITYRRDTKNRLSAYYDWRTVKFRRWALSTSAYYYAFWSNNVPDPDDYQDRLTFGSNNTDCYIGSNTYNIVMSNNNRNIRIGSDVGALGSGVTIASNCNAVTIDDKCANVLTTGSGYIGGIFIDNACTYINIGKRSYNISIGANCYAIDLGLQNNDISIAPGTIRGRLEKGYSNFEVFVALTGKTIDLYNTSIYSLPGLLYNSAQYAGIVNVTSGNAVDTLDKISAQTTSIAYSDIQIRPEAGLKLLVRDKGSATTAGANFHNAGNSIIADGDSIHYVTVHKNISNTLSTQPTDFYLSYTNVISGNEVGVNIYNSNGTITSGQNRLVSIPQTSSLTFSAKTSSNDSSYLKQSKSWIWSGYSTMVTQKENSIYADSNNVSISTYDNVNGEGVQFNLGYIGTGIGAYFNDYTASPKGIQYLDDYRGSFVDRSLVDKEYVDDAISAGSVNIYTIDGTINEERTVSINEDYFLDFKINKGVDEFVSHKIAADAITSSFTNPDGSHTDITMQPNSINLIASGAGSVNGSDFTVTPTATTFQDNNASPKGIQYVGNYNATFVDRSLVDKRYVDSSVATVSGVGGTDNLNDVAGRDSNTVHSIQVQGNNKYLGVSSLVAFGSVFLTHNETAGGAIDLTNPAGATVNLKAITGNNLSVTGGLTVSGNINSPMLVTPALGTPVSGNFSSGTFTWPTFNQNTTGSAGSVAAANITGLGTAVATFLATPTSANFFAAITDESGTTGSVVRQVTPTIYTPNITSPNITPGSANVVGMTLQTYSVTGANSTNFLDMSGTWNTSGTPTGIKLNITNTASGAAKLMDLQIGGASVFNVGKSGALSIGSSLADASAVIDVTSTTKGSRPVPAMTTAQRDAISSPAAWLQIICTDCTATDGSTGVLQVYNLGITTWKNAW